jgi:signal transduction histidine kinase
MLELGIAEASTPAEARVVTRALASARRMRGIVDGLFEFARSGGRSPIGAHCDFAGVVNAVVEESRAAAERAGITLACELSTTGEVACSGGILTVVLSNLINNAVKFMGDAREREITLRVAERLGAVVFSVADSGPGLPAGFEARAFEPYVRASSTVAGLGLGLATVKRLALAHGGTVAVTRVMPAGACFSVTLPRPDDPAHDRSR